MTLLTGVAYPLLTTGIVQVLFPSKANGSLIIKDNKVIGSELIGQQFDSCIYFSARPSAINYDAACSGASNLSKTSAKLHKQIDERRKAFIRFNGLDSSTIVPAEMVEASGSGLDPHISVKAARLQVDRIVKARQLNEAQKQTIIEMINQSALYSLAGTSENQCVNVLCLNLNLDKL